MFNERQKGREGERKDVFKPHSGGNGALRRLISVKLSWRENWKKR